MRISGNEPSSVILNMKYKKMKSYDQKVPKQAEDKRENKLSLKYVNFFI